MSELSEVDKTKRLFMGLGSIVIGAGIGGALAYPIFQFAVGNALKTGEGGEDKNWIDLGSVADFEEGKPTAKKITIEIRDGWVKSSSDETIWVVKRGNDFLTFTATCPHLGCKVNWIPERNEYFCPCHNSAFDVSGEKNQVRLQRADSMRSNTVSPTANFRSFSRNSRTSFQPKRFFREDTHGSSDCFSRR